MIKTNSTEVTISNLKVIILTPNPNFVRFTILSSDILKKKIKLRAVVRLLITKGSII